MDHLGGFGGLVGAPVDHLGGIREVQPPSNKWQTVNTKALTLLRNIVARSPNFSPLFVRSRVGI